MKYRKLRIAFSAVCGALCLLLVALWVRSYSARESLSGWFPYCGFLQLTADQGVMVLIVTTERWKPGLHVTSETIQGKEPPWNFKLHDRNPNFWWFNLNMPFWFAIPIAVVCGTLPWIRCRFRLRTLLIAITLIGLILGTIIATTR